MAGVGRHHADGVLIAALAAGLTQQQAAKQAGISERTVRTRLADPGFKQQVLDARASLVEGTMAQLTASGTEAVASLRQLLRAESESVRLGAAKSLIELAGRLRESHDLEARIAVLEAQANQSQRKNTQWLT